MAVLLALCFAIVALPQAAPKGTVRRHDPSPLFQPRDEGPVALDLCPRLQEELPDEERGRLLEPQSAAELFPALIANSGIVDLGPLAVTEDGVVEIVASDAVHADLARLIDGLEGALLGEELLEVRALELRDEADFNAIPQRTSEAEADHLEQELIGARRATLRRVANVALPDASPVATRSSESSPYARDFEVEICHGSAIHWPVIAVDEVGLALSVRADHLDGATWLDLALREVEAAKPSHVRRIETRAWFTSPEPHEGSVLNATREDLSAATFDGKVPLSIESPLNGVFALAGSFVVPNGSVLWIPARIVTATGPVALLLELRVRGPWRPAVANFELDTAFRRAVSIVHLGALQSRGFTPPRYDRTTFGEPPPDERDASPGPRDEPDPWWPSRAQAPALEADPYGAVAELSARLGGMAGCTVKRLSAHHLVVAAPADGQGEVAQAANEVLAAPPTFGLHVRILRGEAPIAEFRIPAVARRQVTLWSGIATTHLEGWGVDVANESVVGNPVMCPLFDGIALTFAVRPESQRRALLTLNGALCLLEELPARTELGSGFTPAYEKKRARRLAIDDAHSFDLAGAPATLRFGGSALAVEVTVTPAAN